MDFTGDGIADILSGCYWSQDEDCPDGNPQAGYIYVLEGTDDNHFKAPRPLLTANEKPLTNVPLTKEQMENYSSENINWSNICTSQFAVDYDGDGDLDLVVGEMGSGFHLHLNSAESPSAAPVFADEPQTLDIQLPDQHSDPHFVDWDGDGDLDLVSGSSTGSVFLAINEGSAAEAKWADFERLIEGHNSWDAQYKDDLENLTPGHGVRVCVTDFNRDGKLDILAGDSLMIKNEIPGLTPEKADELRKEYEEEMNPLQEQMQKIYEKYTDKIEQATKDGDKEATKKLREKIEKETEGIYEKMTKLRDKEKLFRDQSMTGFVWVYLQK